MSKPVLFAAFANDRDDLEQYLRNLPHELRGIRAALSRGVSAGDWELVERPNATIDDILDVFQNRRYRDRIVAFHYGGHANSYELLLETATGSAAPAKATGLAVFLGQQESLRFVFLNACSTEGHVRQLLHVGVPAVIATSQGVDDAVATRFAVRFYRGLAGGASLFDAFEEGAAAVRIECGDEPRNTYSSETTESDQWPWRLHYDEETTCHWKLLAETVDAVVQIAGHHDDILNRVIDRDRQALRVYLLATLAPAVVGTLIILTSVLFPDNTVIGSQRAATQAAGGFIASLGSFPLKEYLNRKGRIGLTQDIRDKWIAHASAPDRSADYLARLDQLIWKIYESPFVMEG